MAGYNVNENMMNVAVVNTMEGWHKMFNKMCLTFLVAVINGETYSIVLK